MAKPGTSSKATSKKPSGPRKSRVSRRAAAPAEPLELGGMSGLLGYHLRCAQVALFQDFHKAFGNHDLSPPQYGALLLIEANPGISQSAIAETLRFDRSTLVQIIDKLERRNLVVRAISERDRRSHALKITEHGTETMRGLKEISFRHEAYVARGLSDQELTRLKELLEKIHRPS